MCQMCLMTTGSSSTSHACKHKNVCVQLTYARVVMVVMMYALFDHRLTALLISANPDEDPDTLTIATYLDAAVFVAASALSLLFKPFSRAG